ncbi:Uncharacterized protein SCF082_LOCUS28890 [Durusdinium trenchii]|uniref:Uncharacterized protein n=1 Tax=Durusdinium trenchii TaxID=1381693 RepID=A0ABP0MQA0_9DINO
MARVAALCILAAALCMLRNIAFVSAPARTTADPAVAAGAAVLATVPMGADAFVFKGKEYFDVFYGIEPLAWAFCGFVIVYYGAVVKNAAQKRLTRSKRQGRPVQQLNQFSDCRSLTVLHDP